MINRTIKAYLVCVKKKIAEGYTVEEIDKFISDSICNSDRTIKAYLTYIKRKISEGYTIEEIDKFVSYLMHDGKPSEYKKI